MNYISIALIVGLGFEFCLADIPNKHGVMTVAGYGAKKKAVTACGGNALDLAVGMLEGPMDGYDYPYGDKKTGDSANFGLFKQNWGMIRQAHAEWNHLTGKDYNTGAALNKNVCLDVSILHASQKRLGMDLWFAGHRAGSNNPKLATVIDYRRAVEFIRDEINKDYKKYSTDDTRYWVEVTAI